MYTGFENSRNLLHEEKLSNNTFVCSRPCANTNFLGSGSRFTAEWDEIVNYFLVLHHFQGDVYL